MNYLNLHTDVLRSEEYLGAEPIERATWLNLVGWCCSQENSGVILGAKLWGERKWLQLCGVTKEEAESICELYQFDGDDLNVNFYPIEKEAEVKAKRKAGKRGGRPKKQQTDKATPPKEEKPDGFKLENQDAETVKPKKKAKKKTAKTKVTQLPHGKPFAEAWAEWLEHLKQKRSNPTDLAKSRQIKKLESLTESDAIHWINHAIEKNWQGFYDPNKGASQNTTSQNPNQYRCK